MGSPDIRNLDACIAACRRACASTRSGPPEPRNYDRLFERFVEGGIELPRLLQEHAYVPFTKRLHQLGRTRFDRILRRDESREGEAGQMLDISHAILQNAEGFEAIATDAFQELVSDLYDGFLSNEDRKNAKRIDRKVVAPLVKWGYPDEGPYVWSADSNRRAWGVGAGIVNMPPALARGGLLGWAILGHETTGHDILHADKGLMRELGTSVRRALRADGFSTKLSRYWASRIDETASDVLGMLNLGPAAGIGLIGHFRGWNEALGSERILSGDGPADDEHPTEILRGFLAAEAVSRLRFTGKAAWATVLVEETYSDVQRIRAGELVLSADEAHASAAVVAETITRGKMRSLNGLSLGEIQNWRNRDEAIVEQLRTRIRAGRIPDRPDKGHYAAHALVAGIYESLAKGADVKQVFRETIAMLQRMHTSSGVWGEVRAPA